MTQVPNHWHSRRGNCATVEQSTHAFSSLFMVRPAVGHRLNVTHYITLDIIKFQTLRATKCV
jgi:hypothetical protein